MSTQRCRSEVVLATYAEWRYVRSTSFFLAVLVLPTLLLLLARPPRVLPLISVISLTCAAVAALAAWWRSSERNGARFNLWDLSGAYAFTGFAAAMLSEPQQVIEFWSASPEVPKPFEEVKPQ
jgi:hypothetical protein